MPEGTERDIELKGIKRIAIGCLIAAVSVGSFGAADQKDMRSKYEVRWTLYLTLGAQGEELEISNSSTTILHGFRDEYTCKHYADNLSAWLGGAMINVEKKGLTKDSSPYSKCVKEIERKRDT